MLFSIIYSRHETKLNDYTTLLGKILQQKWIYSDEGRQSIYNSERSSKKTPKYNITVRFCFIIFKAVLTL